MEEANIEDRDRVVLQSTEFQAPQPNGIVAAHFDGGTTLKHYLVSGGQPFSKAENRKYRDPIPSRKLLIQGVYVGLLRGVHLAPIA